MARLLTTGFETATINNSAAVCGENESGWSANTVQSVGTVTIQNTVARNGGYAAQCGPSAGNYIQSGIGNHTNGQPMYMRAYVRFNSAPSGSLVQFFTWRINAVAVADIVLNNNRTMSLRDATQTVIGTSSALSVDTWYRIESKIIVNTGTGVGTLELKIDGSVVATSSSAATGTSVTTTTHRFGHLNAGETAMTVYVDDMAYNDHNGSDQNGYPGEGSISLCLPVSDNAIGTGWETPLTTGSDTTSLYDAIDNRPPAGVAHSDVDANNNKYLFNAANIPSIQDYRCNCATLATTAGTSSLTVALTQAYMRGSCNSTTGTNTFELQSMTPSDSTTTVDLEVTAVAGTEPTGWKSYRGTPQYSPAVTASTTPVIRMSKIITGMTRAHMVDLAGLMAEWYSSLIPPPGSATASAPVPTIVITPDPAVASATASAGTHVVDISGGAQDATIIAVPGSADASAPAPTPVVAVDALATATASLPAPAVVIDDSDTAPPASATASAPAPAVTIAVTAAPCSATASAPTPTVVTAGNATITATPANASASAPVPAPTVIVTGPPGSTTGTAPAPSVSLTVVTVAGGASGSAPNPVPVFLVTGTAATATGTIAAPSPSLSIHAAVAAAVASGLGPHLILSYESVDLRVVFLCSYSQPTGLEIKAYPVAAHSCSNYSPTTFASTVGSAYTCTVTWSRLTDMEPVYA
jgi:hypothetical protein